MSVSTVEYCWGSPVLYTVHAKMVERAAVSGHETQVTVSMTMYIPNDRQQTLTSVSVRLRRPLD